MTKVYVVEEGDYSDRHITGIYTTPELAEKAKEAGLGWGWTEYDLDTYAIRLSLGFKHFYVAIAEDGKVLKFDLSDSVGSYNRFYRESDYKGGMVTMVTYMWAKDDIHAIKIANERRVQLIATGRWGVRHDGSKA